MSTATWPTWATTEQAKREHIAQLVTDGHYGKAGELLDQLRNAQAADDGGPCGNCGKRLGSCLC